jgi:hypothetical protein
MIINNWRGEILALAEYCCESMSLKLSQLSNRIAKDADFLDHLKGGGGCTVDKQQKVLRWFRDNMPPDQFERIVNEQSAR